jgi:DNA adenine methylase
VTVATPQTNTSPLPPPLKWAGGKRWLVPHLQSIWRDHAHRRLVEPFVGGLAVALGLMPEQALLNDINPHLMAFYSWLRRGLSLSIDLANDEALYYRYRARFNALVAQGQAECREAAELFFYLNRTGYNGLCRFNRSGAFNVPFGRHKSITYARDFLPYRHILAPWQLTCLPFEQISLLPDDFVYADPPYDVPFTSYSRQPFGWGEQVRLAEWLARHSGPVVLSNQATPRILDLYRSLRYQTRLLAAPRMISCSGDRTPAQEVLAFRNLSLEPPMLPAEC